MKKDPILITVIVIVIVVFSGIIFVAMRQQGPAIAKYSNQDADRPQLQIDQTEFDFGKMSLSETRTKEIQIKNKGDKPLIISDLITSCDCTFAQMTIEGKESPSFSMRREASWRGEVLSQKTAILKITYQPSRMPVKGSVKREVVFKTNDPGNPTVDIRFTAFVE